MSTPTPGQDDWGPDPGTTPAPGTPGNPFGVEAVDPLLYVDDGLSPELRPDAAYVPQSPRLQIRDARPVPPGGRTYEPWTPGDTPAPPSRQSRERRTAPSFARRVLVTVLAAVPLLLGLLVVAYGLRFYNH